MERNYDISFVFYDIFIVSKLTITRSQEHS